jgi:hypothetical protein
MTTTPSAHELRKLAVVAVCSERTARRWYQGKRLQENSRVRLAMAAKQLRLPLPTSTT